MDLFKEIAQIEEGLQWITTERAGLQEIGDGFSRAERDTIRDSGGGGDAGLSEVCELTEFNDFMEKIKILAGLAFVHPALLAINAGADGHGRPDGLEGVRAAGKSEALDVIAEMQFVEGDRMIDFSGKRA